MTTIFAIACNVFDCVSQLFILFIRHDAKEQDLNFQRKSLSETQKLVHQQEERLLEKESLLNQRELYMLDRAESLNRKEKQLEAEMLQLEADRRAFLEEKCNLDLRITAISTREEVLDITKPASNIERSLGSSNAF